MQVVEGGKCKWRNPILSTESTRPCRLARGLPRRSRWSARTPLRLWESEDGSTAPGGIGGFASSGIISFIVIREMEKKELTHARTPPINPRLYPVAKSSFRTPPIGLSGRGELSASTRDRCDLLPPVGLARGPRPLPQSMLLRALGAGLLGRLFCQICRSSRPNS